jgi:hypothetical protein
MHTSIKVGALQQTLIQKCRNNSPAYTFFNLLTDSQLFSKIEGLLPAHRERKFPPTETLSMFLAQAMNDDRSCQNIVNQTVLTQALSGMKPCSSNTGSYCKARRRLPLSMVSELVRHTGTQMANKAPASWGWKGRPVRLVDGTTVVLPDTAENQKKYPQTKTEKGCPMARIVGLICLASGGLINAAIGTFIGKGSGEQTLLRGLLDSLEPDDILLGDAYFGTYFLLSDLMQRKVDGVFEQLGARKRKVDFRKGKKLGKYDHLITYLKPKAKPAWLSQEQYDAAPDTLIIRELKVGHKILVTTLLSSKIATKEELKELYHQRWHIELDLRNIKTTLGMATLSCKTPDMIEKEIWVYLLAHNLIRITMAQAAYLSDILPRQLSFKHSLQLWRIWRQQVTDFDDNNSLEILLLLIVENTVGHRPGRVEPRAIKRWVKSFPILTKPRSELRAEIKLYGHPKKAA